MLFPFVLLVVVLCRAKDAGRSELTMSEMEFLLIVTIACSFVHGLFDRHTIRQEIRKHAEARRP